MEILQLNKSHQTLFEDFISNEIEVRKLQNDHLWSNIEFISDSRKIYAVINEGKIQQTIASNRFPNMPWSKSDTQITAKGLSFYQTKDTTKELFKLFLSSCESDGIWGHWYIRDVRIDNALKRKADRQYQGVNMSRFAVPVVEIFDEKYNFTEAAYVKAGNLTGNKTYDWMLGFEPLPYDVRIRFVTMKLEYITSTMKESITYG